ncbi:hypothetical protein IGI04_023630 [Brassica rapa subsp. trilocularis]|uniref:RNase H type-1 domain-containing protein n=1 Tax=Brassica rapa subsp. trilocularis TaxID=1813537 RepID=A0ABQ7M4F5_BRACM|nr:hypothetical protein IGI04_023630 [Brassica rapa subsp. trilocularis]
MCSESDSSQLIKAVNSGNCVPELDGVVADILSFASIFEFISFVWISRERNGQADMLAKLANLVANLLTIHARVTSRVVETDGNVGHDKMESIPEMMFAAREEPLEFVF